jgi:hypothetical protein
MRPSVLGYAPQTPRQERGRDAPAPAAARRTNAWFAPQSTRRRPSGRRSTPTSEHPFHPERVFIALADDARDGRPMGLHGTRGLNSHCRAAWRHVDLARIAR